MASKMLKPQDLLVEIRDKNLIRRGSIPTEDLQLKMQPVFNGIGAWSVTLPAEHNEIPKLRQMGAGIIVTNIRTKEVLLSGTASKPSKKATAADKKGMVSIAGLTDDRLVWDAYAVADVGMQENAQRYSHDVRTGNAETLMREYVAMNIANGAVAVGGAVSWAPAWRLGGLRNFLRLEAANTNLGATLTKRARFDKIGDLLKEISAESGVNLGFRVVQVGSFLEFQVYAPTDRTAFIRLDVANGTLSEQSMEFSPPEVTRLAVAGQGEGAERTIVKVTNTEATQAETDWGLIIEEFKDQRNTNVIQELTDSGNGILDERGFTRVAVKANPSNDQTMVFMRDFFLGDKVTVIVDGQEPKSYVTEAAIVVNADGVKTAVAIGDIYDFDSTSALRGLVNDNIRRVEQLERNSEFPVSLTSSGQQVADWNEAITTGFYWSTSSAANRPYNASFLSGHVYLNFQTGFERVVQEVLVPSSAYTNFKYLRVGSYSGGVLSFGPWYRDDGIIMPAGMPSAIVGGTWDPVTGRINMTAGAKALVIDGLTDPRFRSWRIDWFVYTGDANEIDLRWRKSGADIVTSEHRTQSMYIQGSGTPAGTNAASNLWPDSSMQVGLGWQGWVEVHNVKANAAGVLVQKNWNGRTYTSGGTAALNEFVGWLGNEDASELTGVSLRLSNQGINGFSAGGWCQIRGIA